MSLLAIDSTIYATTFYFLLLLFYSSELKQEFREQEFENENIYLMKKKEST